MTVATASGGLSDLRPGVDIDEPSWMSQLRSRALDVITERGFPTTRDEDWRYTRITPLLDLPFEPAQHRPDGDGNGDGGTGRWPSSRLIEELIGGAAGPRMVFVNGRFVSELSELHHGDRGVSITGIGSAIAERRDILEPILQASLEAPGHAFGALNTALLRDGVLIELAPGVVVDEPVRVLHYCDPGGTPVVCNLRSVLVLGAGSRISVEETFAGAAGAVYLTNSVTDVRVGPEAVLEHYKVQLEPETAFHLASMDVRQERASTFATHSAQIGASIGRQELVIQLRGEGAEAAANGLYLPHGNQHHDCPVRVEHVAPGCTSRQLFKGVLDGHGQGVFNGHIVVHHGADGTDASQTNKNLLLSDRAEADTRPRLEIFADDVKCTHGSAVGQLEDDAVFYLQARGISKDEARSLLTYAFVNEVVDQVPSAAARDRIARFVGERLREGSVGIGSSASATRED